MSVPIEEILRTLRLFPAGVSTKDLAARLSMKPSSLATRLGKQHLYGGPVERGFIRARRRPQPIWSPR